MQLKSRESDEWLSALENEMWKSFESKNDVGPVLKLSYDHLPNHLKQCFAYCAMFPKDYEFDKETLIQLWMAQGYVQCWSQSGNESLEEIGDGYFNELLFKSFFQKDGYCYKMHDLIHDLAQSITGDSCFVVNHSTKDIPDRVQHVYFEGLPFEECLRKFKNKGLRTLFFSGELDINLDIIISNCRSLCVLSLRGWDINGLPDSIGKLKHLRELPRDIRKLICLRSLMIDGCDGLKYIPVCLGIKEGDVPRFTVSDLSSLVSLPRELQYVTTLRRLRIWSCSNLTALPDWMGNLTSLEYLQIKNCPKLKSLPKVMRQITTLQRLIIKDCPNLSARCGHDMAADWPNISHIPSIMIDRHQIRERSRYLLEEEGDSSASTGIQPGARSDIKATDPKTWRTSSGKMRLKFLDFCKMAEQIPFTTAENLLSKLTSFASEEIGLVSGYKNDLRRLQTTLSTIKAVLLDAEEKQEESHAVKDWIKRLKEVVYDADDLLDDVATEDNQSNVSVVPTVGFGGLGKTTLAQLVYNDEKVVNYFDLKIWACVSEESNVEMIVKIILKRANVEVSDLSLEQLQIRLRKHLEGKKYLMVLDDVWNVDYRIWGQLRKYLMDGAIGKNEIWKSFEDDSDVGPVLKLSYDHLPYHLKQCFTYCAMFPKDYAFDKEILIYLWMAQGYVQCWSQSGNESIKEIGDGYFNELLFRDADLVPQFPCLSNLTIRNCPNLTLMPTFPSLDIELDLSNANIRPLHQTLKMKIMTATASTLPSTSSSVTASFPKLKSLYLEEIEGLSSLPGEWMQNLISLENLTVSDLSSLVSLPRELQYVTTLQRLTIFGCSNLTALPDWMGNLT
ncbi:hypothetical protein GH714_016871 [Hevea brasiliensis]|uniref:NB-ARC domain-containing protein n=1 Tax=Hevea brasiliensis TaxID=3981 RepID=A0A6A6N5U4_HEVBR|nr:hypothetical protein GH714_016871 [Hevea brasiliensis]